MRRLTQQEMTALQNATEGLSRLNTALAILQEVTLDDNLIESLGLIKRIFTEGLISTDSVMMNFKKLPNEIINELERMIKNDN